MTAKCQITISEDGETEVMTLTLPDPVPSMVEGTFHHHARDAAVIESAIRAARPGAKVQVTGLAL